MKTPSKKNKHLPTPEIVYVQVEGGERNLDKAFAVLFEEVMRRRRLSTATKASLNN